MLLRIADWSFDVDITRSMEYYAAEAAEHCTCGYCRNFYAAVDAHYPDLREFFALFGVDIEAPYEQMPFDVHDGIVYDSVYPVYGSILKNGKEPFWINDVSIQPLPIDSRFEADFATEHCFLLEVNTVNLPWVLPEPMENTISPANEQSFLDKMMDRLLTKAMDNEIKS